MASVKIGSSKFKVPGSPVIRVLAGISLIISGILGFLPILGFWMIPLGVIFLSVDFHPIRRFRRRFDVKYGRWQRRRRRQRRENTAYASSKPSEPRKLPLVDPE